MFTTSQQRALDTSRHLSVTANAGSGKTLVLVERYITILLSGKARVKEVVAITFTDKAASELRRKIADGIATRIAGATDPQARKRLEEIRDQLSAAVVDTIHSFCSKILREHPVEAGVDAAFTVLEVVDQQVMLEAAMKNTFDALLKEKEGSGQREGLFDLLRVLGKFKVLETVRTLALKREQVERWVVPGGIYTRSDEDILTVWRRHLTDFVTREFADPRVTADLQYLVESAKPNAVMTLRPLFNAFARAADLHERLHLFGELLEKILTKEGGLRKKVFGEDERLAEPASRLKAKSKALSHLIRFVTGTTDEAHRALLQQSRMLLELYQNVIERYEVAKREKASLDFDDLQMYTRNVLRDEKVRRKLALRYKFIMVDEYQDTNKLQYDILLPLVHNLAGGNLFIVGDPKQSVYGFRNAEVAVFNQTRRDLETAAGSESAVVLADSFRLLRDIVAFVNHLFAPLMNAGDSAYEVGYQPLVRGRQNEATGRVELILRDGSEEESLSEGELIARRILQLFADKHQVFGKDELPRAMTFADVAILLRSRAGLGELEEALIRHRIPYLVSSGVGYFQTQGIYDFYNYFRFLLNTDDDVALAGILRSPFFTVSDAELYDVTLEKRGRSLWEVLCSGAVRRFPSLVRAVSQLGEHLVIASRLSVPDLVNRIIDETSYAGFVAGTPRAGQTSANIEKLKRFARSYEQQGFTTLYDFVNRLKRLIEQEEQEGQAAVDVLADAVKVMTIHAAKGLEFPIVVVPTLDRSFRYDNEPFLDDELGLGFVSGGTGEEEGNIPIGEFLRHKARMKLLAEEKRILYVACTRARDMLILSGLQKDNRSSVTYMTWVLECLSPGETLQGDVTCNVVTRSLRIGKTGYDTGEEKHELVVHVLTERSIAPGSGVEVGYPLPGVISRMLIEPLMSEPRGEIFSASKIRTYVDCPSKYFLRYVAGLPSATTRHTGDHIDEEGDAEIPADLRGRAFHHIMQHIDQIGEDTPEIIDELGKFIARDSYAVLSEPSIALEELARSVVGVLHSPFWRDVQRGSDAATERSIMATLGNDFLTGTLDRVYRNGQGVWQVLDFKTDAVTERSLPEKAITYEPQVKFYAFLVHKFHDVDEVQATLLFTALPEKPAAFTYRQNEFLAFEKDLLTIISNIHARKFSRKGKPCIGCPFPPNGCPPISS